MNQSTLPLGLGCKSRKNVTKSDILYFKGDQNYTHVYFLNGKSLLVATTLKVFEDRLSSQGFFRANKTFLVNLSCIQHFEDLVLKGNLKMVNDDVVGVSRRKTKILKEILSSNNFLTINN